MKLLYTHENRLIVFNIKNLLEEQGIECEIGNEFSGGGVGVLSPLETWPELWVSDSRDYEQAEQILQQVLSQRTTGSPWQCSNCGESSDDNFEICWNCYSPKN